MKTHRPPAYLPASTAVGIGPQATAASRRSDVSRQPPSSELLPLPPRPGAAQRGPRAEAPRTPEAEAAQLRIAIAASLQGSRPEAPSSRSQADAQLRQALAESREAFDIETATKASLQTLRSQPPVAGQAQASRPTPKSIQIEADRKLAQALSQDTHPATSGEPKLSMGRRFLARLGDWGRKSNLLPTISPRLGRRQTAPATSEPVQPAGPQRVAGDSRQTKPAGPARSQSAPATSELDQPLKSQLVLGHALNDGNCFFHSIGQFDAPEIAAAFGRPMAQISHADLRRHVASHAIGQMLTCSRGGPAAESLMARHPHLVHLMSSEAEGEPPRPRDFEAVVGRQNAMRCAGMTPSQRTHVFNVARNGSWDSFTGEIIPHATVAAFPGLRLSIVTDRVTARNLAEHTYGGREDGPARVLYLSGKHFVPAMLTETPPRR